MDDKQKEKFDIDDDHLNNLYIEGRKATEIPDWLLQPMTDEEFEDFMKIDDDEVSFEEVIKYIDEKYGK